MGRNSNSTVEQRKAFSVALEAAMQSAGIRSAADLHRRGAAAGISRTADTFTAWCRGENEPARNDLLMIEKICGVEPGHLSRHLGWVPVDVNPQMTIEQMILAHPDLTDSVKQVMLTLFENVRKP